MIPNDYGDAVLNLAGCTCHPKRVIQELDDKGSFVIEHYHTDACAKTSNAAKWKGRVSGLVSADHRTTSQRFTQRQAFLDEYPKRPTDVPTRVVAPRQPYKDD
jgi:hypothetical protein